MNGIHDLGGMHGFGPINPEKNEPVFHADWEKRVMALFPATFLFAGYTVDEFRHSIENMGAIEYLEGSYYEHWLHVYEEILDKRGFVTRAEMDKRVAEIVKGAK